MPLKPKRTQVTPEMLREMIQKKAYEIYCKRGNKPGSPLSDWITAEKEVKTELELRR